MYSLDIWGVLQVISIKVIVFKMHTSSENFVGIQTKHEPVVSDLFSDRLSGEPLSLYLSEKHEKCSLFNDQICFVGGACEVFCFGS